MKKVRFIILVLISFIVTACNKYNYDVDTINYRLDIGKTFKENIVFTFRSDAYDLETDPNFTGILIEDSILKDDSYPIFSNYNVKYNKKIKNGSDRIEAVLDYEYTDGEFLYSNYMMNCFENYDINSMKDYFEIHLSGHFSCYQNDKIFNINVKTNHEILETNGIDNGDYYYWKIDSNNYENVDLYYKISREYESMATVVDKNTFIKDIIDILKYVVGIIVIIFILVKLYRFLQKRNNDVGGSDII